MHTCAKLQVYQETHGVDAQSELDLHYLRQAESVVQCASPFGVATYPAGPHMPLQTQQVSDV